MKKLIYVVIAIGLLTTANASNRGACKSYMNHIDMALLKATDAKNFGVEEEVNLHKQTARKYFYYLRGVCFEGQNVTGYFERIKNFK